MPAQLRTRTAPRPVVAAKDRYAMTSPERYSWPLSPSQVAEERAHVAADLLFLLLYDHDGLSLPPRLAQQVQRLFAALQQVQEELGCLADPSRVRREARGYKG